MNYRKYWELIKLFIKFLRFRVRQYQLKTNEYHIAETSYGKVKGVKRLSIWGQPFYSFEGIPFASPPIGELRFKAPIPPNPWQGVKDCTKEKNIPLQINLVTKMVQGSEDCLYLNVYTKKLPSQLMGNVQLLPVLVWIYGGGFENGGASKDLYSPDFFLENDVVFISIQYRLGPFGFISFIDPEVDVPGNSGLKDQVLALKWVKANCKNFCGDPDNITLFGESAGAASTHYMMLTEQTKGLFNKAMLMSGSALCPWALHSEKNMNYRLIRSMGYEDSDICNDKKCFELLKKSSGKKILNGEIGLLTSEEKEKGILFPFGPVIEPYKTHSCVIPELPLYMTHNCWSNNIPIIIGGTGYEGLILMLDVNRNPNFLNKLGRDCENLVPYDLYLAPRTHESRKVAMQIKKEFFNDRNPCKMYKYDYLDYMSYKLFWHPIHRTILSRMKYAPNAKTYVYRFDVDSTFFNSMRRIFCGDNVRGTCHGDDLCYLFLNILTPYPINKASEEYNAIKNFSNAWYNFAKSSNPNTSRISINEFVQMKDGNDDEDNRNTDKWLPVTNSEVPYNFYNFSLRSNDFISMPLMSEKLNFLDNLYPSGLLY